MAHSIKCIVCGKSIGTYGWPNHVSKEKRLHGEEIYRRLRAGEPPKQLPIKRTPVIQDWINEDE